MIRSALFSDLGSVGGIINDKNVNRLRGGWENI